MPFGRYRGQRLRDLPDGYLGWLRDECELREPLRMRVEHEYQRRIGSRHRRRREAPLEREGALAPSQVAVALRIVARGFRAAAHDAHPDHGGSDAQMRELVAVREALERIIRGRAA
jgi:hypothetical protein